MRRLFLAPVPLVAGLAASGSAFADSSQCTPSGACVKGTRRYGWSAAV
jgi:hypothetical protein